MTPTPALQVGDHAQFNTADEVLQAPHGSRSDYPMTAKKKPKTIKPVKAWAGFSDGKLDWYVADRNFAWEARVPAIFGTRVEAKARYEDFRRVEIRVKP